MSLSDQVRVSKTWLDEWKMRIKAGHEESKEMARGKMDMSWTKENWHLRGLGMKDRPSAPRLGVARNWRARLLARARLRVLVRMPALHMARQLGSFLAATSVSRPLVVNGQGWHVSINESLRLKRKWEGSEAASARKCRQWHTSLWKMSLSDQVRVSKTWLDEWKMRIKAGHEESKEMARGKMDMSWTKENWHLRGLGMKDRPSAPRLGVARNWRARLLARARLRVLVRMPALHMARQLGSFLAATSVSRPLVVNGQGWHVSINESLRLKRKWEGSEA
ncbi:hypothetical protein HAX54_005369, partial [Datura stramonium]|nr:hypothetical protein [Datura stramonium]